MGVQTTGWMNVHVVACLPVLSYSLPERYLYTLQCFHVGVVKDTPACLSKHMRLIAGVHTAVDQHNGGCGQWSEYVHAVLSRSVFLMFLQSDADTFG